MKRHPPDPPKGWPPATEDTQASRAQATTESPSPRSADGSDWTPGGYPAGSGYPPAGSLVGYGDRPYVPLSDYSSMPDYPRPMDFWPDGPDRRPGGAAHPPDGAVCPPGGDSWAGSGGAVTHDEYRSPPQSRHAQTATPGSSAHRYSPAEYSIPGYPVTAEPGAAYYPEVQAPESYSPGGAPAAACPPNSHSPGGAPAVACPPSNGRSPGAYRTAGNPAASYPADAYPPGGYPPGGYPAAAELGAEDLATLPATEHASFPAASPDEATARMAMLAYLTLPIFGFVAPLVFYLVGARRSRWLRAHAAQALNVWVTGILYDLSAAIMGAMLALDTPQTAMTIFLPLVVLLWLVTLAYLVRAATAASQGKQYRIPRWLCSPLTR